MSGIGNTSKKKHVAAQPAENVEEANQKDVMLAEDIAALQALVAKGLDHWPPSELNQEVCTLEMSEATVTMSP